MTKFEQVCIWHEHIFRFEVYRFVEVFTGIAAEPGSTSAFYYCRQNNLEADYGRAQSNAEHVQWTITHNNQLIAHVMCAPDYSVYTVEWM